MEPKKSAKADLENKRNTFVLLGLVLSLLIVLGAFSVTSTVKSVESLGDLATEEIEDEIIPITRQEEIKPPPPPPPPKVIDQLNIVDDDVELEEELEIEDTEADEETMNIAQVFIEEEEEDDTQVFVVVEDMPEFPGGEVALRQWINSHVKYPVIAAENGIQGKVYVQFVVDRDGSVNNVVVARGVDPSLDQEAIRVVKALPKWKPGKQRGKPVRVSYTVPINFQLQ